MHRLREHLTLETARPRPETDHTRTYAPNFVWIEHSADHFYRMMRANMYPADGGPPVPTGPIHGWERLTDAEVETLVALLDTDPERLPPMNHATRMILGLRLLARSILDGQPPDHG